MTLGLASYGIISMAKKHAMDTEAFRSKSARYDREKRLTDWLDDDK